MGVGAHTSASVSNRTERIISQETAGGSHYFYEALLFSLQTLSEKDSAANSVFSAKEKTCAELIITG